VEEAGPSNSFQDDAAPLIDLGAVVEILTAPNPAVVGVYKTICVKSGLIRDDMTKSLLLSCSTNSWCSAAISLEFMLLKLGQILL
jgi:hypothetical protein